jgi:hypothetical protein
MNFDRFEWMNEWIEDERLSTGAKAVLAVLFRYMSDNGRAWPSRETIAVKAGYSKAQKADRYLNEICDAGYIEKAERIGNTCVYVARIPQPVPQTGVPQTGPAPETGTPQTGTPPLSTCTPNGYTSYTPNGYTPKEVYPQTGTGGVPQTGIRGVPQTGTRTDHEQTNEQSRGSRSDVPAEPGELEPDENPLPPLPPTQVLLELCQEADIHLALFQVETLWRHVSTTLEPLGLDPWDYFRWKLSDLHGTTYPSRAKFDFLMRDTDRWLADVAKKNVGAHRPVETTTAIVSPDDDAYTTDAAELILITLPFEQVDRLQEQFVDEEVPSGEYQAMLEQFNRATAIARLVQAHRQEFAAWVVRHQQEAV